jgi:hypothetical protein
MAKGLNGNHKAFYPGQAQLEMQCRQHLQRFLKKSLILVLKMLKSKNGLMGLFGRHNFQFSRNACC